MHEYLFDVKLFVPIRVKAASEEEARALIDRCVNGTSANLGAWPDGEPIVVDVALDDGANHELIEIDGEAV